MIKTRAKGVGRGDVYSYILKRRGCYGVIDGEDCLEYGSLVYLKITWYQLISVHQNVYLLRLFWSGAVMVFFLNNVNY